MSRNIAIQMDPLFSLNPKSDSTLLLGLEAGRRGYDIWCYMPDKLTLSDGIITARAQRVKFHADYDHYYDVLEEKIIDLRDMDVVLLRQDPPFDMQYLTTTYILEQLAGDVLVVNDPANLRNLPEKLFPTLMHKFMPPTLISADISAIENFCSEHKDIVIKPLYGFGGHGVLRIREGDGNFDSLMEMIFATSNEPLMVQPFLPEVVDGERRIILIDGKVGGAMGRIPAEGEIRANFRVGAKPALAALTTKQLEICAALEPQLQKYGLIFAGIDVIGDWLIEVNITSPTGLPAMNRLYGLKLESDIWDAIEKYL